MAQICNKTPGFYCNTCDPHLSGWLKQHVKLQTTGAVQSSWDTLVDMTCSTSMHQDLVRSFLLLLLMENICHHHLTLFTLKTGALKDRIGNISPPRLHSEATTLTHLSLLAPLFPGQEQQTYLSDVSLRLMVFSGLYFISSFRL